MTATQIYQSWKPESGLMFAATEPGNHKMRPIRVEVPRHNRKEVRIYTPKGGSPEFIGTLRVTDGEAYEETIKRLSHINPSFRVKVFKGRSPRAV